MILAIFKDKSFKSLQNKIILAAPHGSLARAVASDKRNSCSLLYPQSSKPGSLCSSNGKFTAIVFAKGFHGNHRTDFQNHFSAISESYNFCYDPRAVTVGVEGTIIP